MHGILLSGYVIYRDDYARKCRRFATVEPVLIISPLKRRFHYRDNTISISIMLKSSLISLYETQIQVKYYVESTEKKISILCPEIYLLQISAQQKN